MGCFATWRGGAEKGKGSVIQYRTFRNSDPPRILDLWQACAQTRGFGQPANCDNLEQLVFSKPYFDYKGLTLAIEDDRVVGMVHAGFSCNDNRSGIDYSLGDICMLLVRPSHRRKGIGSELLKLGHAYLRSKGSKVLYAGPLHPLNPFYLGLYGGSELPGILDSDPGALAFLKKNHYEPVDTCMVFQRSLDVLTPINDHRVPLLARQVELLAEPWPLSPNWWHACLLGPMVSLRYEMIEQKTQAFIGRAWVWEMETFGRSWGTVSVGITDVWIEESRRRQGYGKLLLQGILKNLKDQKIGRLEVQTMQRNKSAIGLYQSVGFEAVDTGHIFRLRADDTIRV